MSVVLKSERPVQRLQGRTLQWLASPATGSLETALLENVIEPGALIPPHSHPVEELLVCLEGAGRVTLEGETQAFGAGDTAIVPAGAVHSVQNAGLEPMRMLGFFPTNRPVAAWVDEQPPLRVE